MGTEEGSISPVKERLVREYKTALAMIRELYEDEGWVFDSSEIENDFSIDLEEKTKILELGWGVKLISDCGCEWKVDKNDGEWERLRECGIEDCEGLPRFSKVENIFVEKNKASEEAPNCGDHPWEKMVWVQNNKKRKGGYWTCPQYKGK